MGLPSIYRSNLLRDEFFAPVQSLFDKISNEFFTDFKPFTLESFRGRTYPKIDIRIDGSDYIVEAALPFVEERDLDVTLDKNILTIKGKAEAENKHDDGCYVHRELSRSAFSRSFQIPEDLYKDWINRSPDDPIENNVVAKLENGILTITLKDLLPEKEKEENNSSPIKIAIK